MKHPETVELLQMMMDFYGTKASGPTYNSQTEQASCVLYESFPLVCGFDEHGGLHASISLSESAWTSSFLGKRVFAAPDDESINGAFDLVDTWCRLRLPDKFLDAFDNREPEKW